MNEFKETVKVIISLILDYIGAFTLLTIVAKGCDEKITVFSFFDYFCCFLFCCILACSCNRKRNG